MKDGFIRVSCASPCVHVADPQANLAALQPLFDRADDEGMNLLCLPELCLSGYTCGDLFLQDRLLDGVEEALHAFVSYTRGKYPIAVLGLPLRVRGKLYSCAAVVHNGHLLGVVAKTFLPNYREFYEMRHFEPCDGTVSSLLFDGQTVPFGQGMIFRHETLPDFAFGVELCEDVWATVPPSDRLVQSGAVLICNPSASNEAVGKDDYRRLLLRSTSARQHSAYVYTNAGPDESTQDLVFSSHNLIASDGILCAESEPFAGGDLLRAQIDLAYLARERRVCNTFRSCQPAAIVPFSQPVRQIRLDTADCPTPFVPPKDAERDARCARILDIQSYGLKKRLAAAHAKTAVLGISGGLDSTLALLVTARAMRLSDRPLTDILAVTMPGFGTTTRTHSNAGDLCSALGVSLREISIAESVHQHFADIGQPEGRLDVTYENAQARERTQILMDLANMTGGIVVGTGDLSELALGYATYNGDHMSMYAVNASIPKTLVRSLIRFEASRGSEQLAAVLGDILDTPVSPELLPAADDGTIAQKTEDLVGPYELHDYFLYHAVRLGERPRKIYRKALLSFAGRYDSDVILKWLRVFFSRFFAQQFKRSCIPDGPKVGSVVLSPRGDFRMPSDASASLWCDEIDALIQNGKQGEKSDVQ